MRKTLGFLAFASAAALGCTTNNNGTAVVAVPVQAAAAGDASAAANAVAFGALTTDAIVPTSPPEVAASSAAQAATTSYTPSGCATATANGGTVTYMLSNCTGPLGTTGLNGTVSVAFTSEGDGLHLSITSPALRVGTDTVVLNRQGIFESSGTARAFRITGDTGSSNGPFGAVVYESAQGALTWMSGAACATYDATEKLTAGAIALIVTDVKIVRCNGQACSQSGTAKVVDPGGGSIVVTYTGTPTARFMESNFNAGSLFLTCGDVT